MIEKAFKYMGNTVKYKEVTLYGEKDDYGRDKTIRVVKQGDAEKITDEETGAMKWSCGAFIDMQVNGYIPDEEYDNLTDDDLIGMRKKLNV